MPPRRVLPSDQVRFVRRPTCALLCTMHRRRGSRFKQPVTPNSKQEVMVRGCATTGLRRALAAPRRADNECPTGSLFASALPAASSNLYQGHPRRARRILRRLAVSEAAEVLYISRVRPLCEHRSKIAAAAAQQSKSHVRPQQAALAIQHQGQFSCTTTQDHCR